MILENMQAIVDKYGKEYVLRQLAEECMELGQAALKEIRAKRMETRVTPEKAHADFIEELADVEIMIGFARNMLMDTTDELACDAYKDMKTSRMVRRLLKGDWSK